MDLETSGVIPRCRDEDFVKETKRRILEYDQILKGDTTPNTNQIQEDEDLPPIFQHSEKSTTDHQNSVDLAFDQIDVAYNSHEKFSHNGEWFISGGQTMQVLSIAKLEIYLFNITVNSVAISNSGNFAVEGENVYVKSGNRYLPESGEILDFSPDEKSLFIIANNHVCCYDVDTFVKLYQVAATEVPAKFTAGNISFIYGDKIVYCNQEYNIPFADQWETIGEHLICVDESVVCKIKIPTVLSDPYLSGSDSDSIEFTPKKNALEIIDIPKVHLFAVYANQIAVMHNPYTITIYEFKRAKFVELKNIDLSSINRELYPNLINFAKKISLRYNDKIIIIEVPS